MDLAHRVVEVGYYRSEAMLHGSHDVTSWKRISPMTVSEVLALLDAERDERGMSNWERLGATTAGMRSYGIGLTRSPTG